MYRLIAILTCCMVLLVSCAGTIDSASEKDLEGFSPIAVDNFNPVFHEINKSQSKKNELLIVFDIDDTLLTAEQLLGSERWVHWYKKNQAKLELLPCRFDIASILYEMGTMRPTESNLGHRFNAIQNNHVMLLTARSNKQRSVTERELLRNKIYFSNSDRLPSKNDWSASIQTKTRKAEIVYKSGLMMIAGTDKGKALTKFMNDNIQSYKKIIFIDDNLHNLENVYSAFKDTGIRLISFYFSGKHIIKEMSQDEAVKAIAANKWLREGLKSFFNPRYKYLLSPKPECLY
ncbi:MAG: DUF2608 domain-containing protein [Nitrospina sp.]|nr:DUF2608 domain-containing protein [Nitrospina sp.]